MPRLLPVLLLLCLGPQASGQWSSDPASNLALADGPGDQVQAKLAPTADGGCYVSWFDGASTGYDVRLQRLDVAGNQLWGHNGILVADRSLNSTQDYGLAVDLQGHALLAYRADHGLALDEIVAARVAPNGALTWGANGVLISGNTSAALAAPKIAAAGDRGIVVAWTEDVEVLVRGLNGSGNLAWTHRETPAPGARHGLADLHSAGNTIMLSLVHQSAGFLSPRHLWSIQLDATGASLWPNPVVVFDGGSLQTGSYPSFTSDGAGGAVFAWYSVNPLQCFAQHILSDGTESYPHNGSPVSTNASQLRISPALNHDAFGGNTYVFWEEQNASQSLFGLSGQKFDSNGQAQWAPTGETLIPLGTAEVRNVRTVANSSGAFVFWTESTGFGSDVLRGRHVDGAGVTDVGPFDVASLPSVKSRPSAALGNSGHALIAWSDQRFDAGDLLIQNINGNGSLGNSPLGSSLCFGVGCPCNNDEAAAGCTNSSGAGATLLALGSTSVATDNLVLIGAQLPANQSALLFAGPGLLNGGAGQPFGAGLLCVSGRIWRLGAIQASASGEGSWGPGLLSSSSWVSPGNARTLQVWYRDPGTSSCAGGFNTSHAVSLGFGQ